MQKFLHRIVDYRYISNRQVSFPYELLSLTITYRQLAGFDILRITSRKCAKLELQIQGLSQNSEHPGN